MNMTSTSTVDLLADHPILFPIVLCVAIFIYFELLARVPSIMFSSHKRIPIKGKHLDEFSNTDKVYIGINKFLTLIFGYHMQYIVFNSKSIVWNLEDISFTNTVVSLLAFYLFYDLLYMTFHRTLHHRSIYSLVHKHHHRQKAPSRGNLDAINVHPFEFVVGEYLHLLAIYVIPSHIVAVALFIVAGSIMASLNHTRYDIEIPHLFSVKVHDVHHRMPESNYGQYTMIWDKVFGSYRSYEHNQSVTSMKDD